MTPRLILRALWRQRWIALVLLVLTLASTVAYLSTAEREYTATASLAIVPGPTQEGFGELSGPLLGTLVDLAQSNDVLAAARTPVPDAPTVPELRSATTVEAVADAFTLRISVTLEDPALAAELANRIAGSLPRFNLVPQRVSYRAVDVARPPTEPSAPQEALVLGVGTLLALALAVAGALVTDDARRQVETPQDLGAILGVPVLARLSRGRDPRQPALTLLDDEALEAGLRRVRVGLVGSSGTTGTVVVAGLGLEDGDRWLATSTAVSLAQVHPRVVLVLSNPGAAGPPLPGDNGAAGLSEALEGHDLQPLLLPTDVPGLLVLGPGREPEALPALLERSWSTVQRQLEASADVVVVDAPSLMTSDDARVLARGGRLLVWNRLGRVRLTDATRRVEDLHAVRAHIAGAVVVRVGRRARASQR